MAKLVFPMAAVVSNIINLLLSLIPLAMLVPIVHHPFYWTWLYLPVPLLALTIFTLGGLSFSRPPMSSTATWLTFCRWCCRLGSTVTPIIYPLDMIPARYQWIFKLNPLIYVINGFRLSVYYGQFPRRHRSSRRLYAHLSSLFIGFAFSGSIRTTLSFTSELSMSYGSTVIRLENVTQRFRVIHERPDTVRELFSKILPAQCQLS